MAATRSPMKIDWNVGLQSLFPGLQLYEDTDGDGYADRLNLFIAVQPGLSDAPLWAAIINLAARLAGEVTVLRHPLAGFAPAVPPRAACLLISRPSRRLNEGAGLHRLGPERVALVGSSAAAMAALVHRLALHPAGRRSASKQGQALRPAHPLPVRNPDFLDPSSTLYAIPDDEPRRRRLLLRIELERGQVSTHTGLALVELTARAALEATELHLPLAFAGPSSGEGIVLRVREQPGDRAASLTTEPDSGAGAVIRAEGGSRALGRCLQEWVRLGFGTGGPGCEAGDRLRAGVGAAGELLTGSGRWGAWAHELAAAVGRGGTSMPAGNRDRTRLARASRVLGIRPPGPWAGQVLEYDQQWISESRCLLEAVGGVPRGSGTVQGLILVSKPPRVRRMLGASLVRILRAKGYCPRLVVLNAYKPGLSWLLEVVRPELKRLEDIARVELAFQPFAAADGLEMESRFLQEIFPGPDLLAVFLGLPPRRIRLVKCPELKDAYRIRVWDSRRRLLCERRFTPRWGRRMYLAGRPHLGMVHPASGGVFLLGPDGVLLDESIPTDRERFWETFQERWLPAIESAMLDRLSAPRSNPPAVFWEDVRFEIALDETDLSLGLGQERVAPMEALHEDLYFVLLDFFRIFAQEKGLGTDHQFGRIFPRVLSRAPGGRPSAWMTARPFPPQPPSPAPASDASFPLVGVRSWRYTSGKLGLELALPGLGFASTHAETLCRIARAWGHDLQPSESGSFLLQVRRRRVSGSRPQPRPATVSPMQRLTRLAEVKEWMRRLGALPHVRSWKAGHTWQGRPVWAIEAALGSDDGILSVGRMRLLKPTLLMNARHHANEVSSTQAVLRLFRELGTTLWGRRILKRVNVAAVPLENADGVATLEGLLPGATGHKLHAARYNALGVEWYADYFRAMPRFPEARVKPRLWRRWLPLVVLDAHGVPSHEWDQPFSGYAPCRFRQYWIPRSFMYAVIPFVDQQRHPGHMAAKALAAAMDRELSADREIRDLNRELVDRYQRYARDFEPDIFPYAGCRSLCVVPPEERVAGVNYAVQEFPLTLSEIITEVTDEVVSGELLELCGRAHLKAAKALLGFLSRQAPGRLVRRRPPEGGLILSWEEGKKLQAPRI